MIIALILFILLALIKFFNRKYILSSNKSKLLEYHNLLVETYINNNKEEIKHKIQIPIYYINLDRSKDRKEYMEKQFEMYDIKATRIPGVNGKDLNNNTDYINLSIDDSKIRKIKFTNSYKNNTLGELGCTLSHIKAIFTAYKNGDENALILEDDNSFALYPYWSISLEKVIENAPKDWNVITLFDFKCSNLKGDYLKFDVNSPCYSTVAYIINRKGMENILHDILHKNKIILDNTSKHSSRYMGADIFIYHQARNTYHYKKHYLFFPYNDTDMRDSTIHTSHTSDHINRAVEILEPYFIKTKKKTFVRRYSTDLTSKIPKVIHVIWYRWKSDEPPKDMKDMLNICKDVNNDFEYKLWDEKMGLDLIKEHYPWFLKTYEKYDVEIKRIDAIRYFILFHYGGIYMDMDTIRLKNIMPLLKDGYAIFGYQLRNKGSISNGFMASPSKHPLFENIIYGLLDTCKRYVIYASGPDFLTRKVKMYNRDKKVSDVIVYDMPLLFTNQWNDSKQIAYKCITDTSLCKEVFPNSYTTTVFAHSWK